MSPLALLDSMHDLRRYLRRNWGGLRLLMETVPIDYPLAANVVAAGVYEPGRLTTEVYLVTPRGWQRIRSYRYWKRVRDEHDARAALRSAAHREAIRLHAR